MKCFFFCTSHNCCMHECKIPRWICLRLCKNLKKKRDKLLAFRFKVFSCDAIENTLVTVWISINSIMSIQFLKGDATQKLKRFWESFLIAVISWENLLLTLGLNSKDFFNWVFRCNQLRIWVIWIRTLNFYHTE